MPTVISAGTASRLGYERPSSGAKLAYFRLNSQTPWPPLMRAWAGLSRLTRGVVGGSFTLDARVAFGNRCDCPSYVDGIVRGVLSWRQQRPLRGIATHLHVPTRLLPSCSSISRQAQVDRLIRFSRSSAQNCAFPSTFKINHCHHRCQACQAVEPFPGNPHFQPLPRPLPWFSPLPCQRWQPSWISLRQPSKMQITR
jgi:hypothetical protein